MARRMVEVLTDDIDGGDATTSITFSIDGTNYVIDLNDENSAKFHETMKKWTSAARKAIKGGASPVRASRSRSGNSNLAAIREWADANGYKVSGRGRIAADIVAAYEAAH